MFSCNDCSFLFYAKLSDTVEDKPVDQPPAEEVTEEQIYQDSNVQQYERRKSVPEVSLFFVASHLTAFEYQPKPSFFLKYVPMLNDDPPVNEGAKALHKKELSVFTLVRPTIHVYFRVSTVLRVGLKTV